MLITQAITLETCQRILQKEWSYAWNISAYMQWHCSPVGNGWTDCLHGFETLLLPNSLFHAHTIADHLTALET